MIKLGLIFHYLNRLLEIAASRYTGWTLECYLRAKSRSCGSIRVAGPCRFANVGALEIGQNVHVNTGAYWVCEGGLIVGDNTIFAKNVTIYTRNHDYTGEELPFDHNDLFRPVYIGRNVWIGANATVLPGAKIGDGAIIGAGAIVAGEVPKGAIFAARKAERLGSRDMDHYYRIDAAQAYHQPIYMPKGKRRKVT